MDDTPSPPQTRVNPPVRSAHRRCYVTIYSLQLFVITILLSLLTRTTSATFIDFDNCLPGAVRNSTPLHLQFIPLHLYAHFNTTDPRHSLNVTVYGNVSGLANDQPYPPPGDPQWQNTSQTIGKIVDLSPTNSKNTTIFAKFDVLTYTPYSNASNFCNSLIGVGGACPLGPAFNKNRSDPQELPAFSITHDFYSSYAFTTFATTLSVTSGDADKALLACVSAKITPDLGRHVSDMLTYLPLVVLILVGVATAFAAIFSPWGTNDTFRWTTNYGRDADLLRLVTPGFGDCLLYIQFILLSGSLSLSYPGYYQPVVSKVSWSALMFNMSFVTHGNGTQSLVDGIYNVNGRYGLERLSQLVGITSVKDIWAGMIIWLLVVVAAVLVLIQIGFVLRWSYRLVSHTQEEDLRAKNLPFSIGNVVRIVFNFFLLPLISLSMFQLVVAGISPAYTVGLAAVLLIMLFGFAGWLLYLIALTRPRAYLFDDLPTLLLYGPLYNTYSDEAATFALVPVLLTFVRGIAIGAVQPSGIAQLVLLAICEVILILTLHAFRPYHPPTSMNAYHTFFAIVRLLCTLLSVAFVPSLGLTEAPKGWIGYVILLMHAIVLVFGFFLNSIQTIVEVAARLAGAGGEEGVDGGAARGGLAKAFGMRQLSRRLPRHERVARDSGLTETRGLASNGDRKSSQFGGTRSRSMSGSSAVLLNRHAPSDGHLSVGLDSIGAAVAANHHRASGSGSGPYTPTTPGGASASSYLPGANSEAGGSGRGGISVLKAAETADPYYRPPRARRQTIESMLPGSRSRASWVNGDWANKRWSQHSPEPKVSPDPNDGPSISGRGTPVPAYLGGATREFSEQNINDHRRSQTDYAVREVDFYYRFRGPALSTLPTRRLGTGPADPTGPVASAAGWFKGLLGGKAKEKGKGFEVIRSSRAPPSRTSQQGGAVTPGGEVPYQDDPEAGDMGHSRGLVTEPGDEVQGIVSSAATPGNNGSPPTSEDEGVSDLDSDGERQFETSRASQISIFPPSLPGIDTGGGIELPSRIGSRASSNPSRQPSVQPRPPMVPRKSSKRILSMHEEAIRLGTVTTTPPPPEAPLSRGDGSRRFVKHRLDPSTASSRLPFGSNRSSASDNRTSAGGESTSSSIFPSVIGDTSIHAGSHARHSSSALGSLAPDISADRPASMGYVQQHRASDNIHRVGSSESPHLGSTAELVEDTSRRSMSAER
ncbi:MAG: hypothetical protein M1835_007258 [Candelina submexicana]|nr:MAG: hypothetical protein M1835_007258 [Candelina submexicana]